MKKLVLFVAIVALVFLVVSPSQAQKQKMLVGPGVDVLIPMGTFGDAVSIGFGGDGRFQYNFTPVVAGVGEVGYFVWSGKTVAGVDLPNFKGFTIRVGGKYYFMPEGAFRVYGMFKIGLFFASVTAPTIQTPLGPIGGGTASETDFCYVPEVGAEVPAGKMNVDFSIRYDGIATTGESSGSIGFRVGLNFPIGQ